MSQDGRKRKKSWGRMQHGSIPSGGRFEVSADKFQFVAVSPAAKCTRRFICQHASVDSLHCGLSFP